MAEEKKVTKAKKTTTTGVKKAATSKKTTTKKATETKKTTATKTQKPKSSSTTKSGGAKKSSSTPTKKKTSTTVSKAKKTTTKVSATKTSTRKKATSTSKTSPRAKKEELPKVSEEKSSKQMEKKIIISEEIVDHVEEVKPTVKETLERKEEPMKIPVSSFTGFLIAAIIAVWILILILVGYQIHRKYQEKLYDQGYFYHENLNIHQITLDHLREELDALSNGSAFIFFNFVGEKDNYLLEQDLEKIIEEYHLKDQFYYVDLSREESQTNCSSDCAINQELGTNLVHNLPAIVYYKNNVVVDVAQREDQKVLEAADFVKLLDMYEFKK